MSFRIEEKIFIKRESFVEFKEWLNIQNSNILYPKRKIKSIYFDNEISQMFLDSEEGCVPRKKIRFRSYPDKKSMKIFMETKISSVEGRYKLNKLISQNEVNSKLRNGTFDNQYGLCKPNLIIEYTREYFKVHGIRITIDKDILYSKYKNTFNKTEDKEIIIELKTNYKTSSDFLLNKFPFQRTRFSKYCNAYKYLFY